MFSLSESNKFMVCTSAVDLRKGVDPLSRMVRSNSMSPTDGSVYVFLNRTRTRMKLLHWERGGYVIFYKRMEQGRISHTVFQSDESTMRVNDQKHKTRKGYIWSDVDGMGTYGLVFFYDKGSRGEKAISPKLLERKAGIHTDGYVIYQNIEKKKLEKKL